MQNSLIADILLGLIVFLLTFGLGFFIGRSSVSPYERVVTKSKEPVSEPEPADETEESAVADSDPKHLKDKFDKRIRSGVDPIDEEESQIITDKTPEQIESEAEQAKEARLDKWMPGVKGEDKK